MARQREQRMNIQPSTQAGQTMITSEVVHITPRLARELLAANTRNRPLNVRRAMVLAQAIRRGEWRLNGDAIRISSTGVVLDGQHRLTAIVESGVAVDSFIIYGLADDVFDTIDVGGRARSAGDVLSIMGEKYYNTVAAIARLNHKYTRYGNPFYGAPEANPTVQQVISEIESNPAIRDSAEVLVRSKWCKKYLSLSIGGFCHFVFSQKDSEAAKSFFSQLEKGSFISEGSPVLLLRDRLAEAASDKTRLSQTYKTALTFKSFRLFMDGASIKILRVRTQGDAPEKDFFTL